MRRWLAILLLSLTAVLSAAPNSQKLYTVSDDIYKDIEALCREAGVIGPQSFSPMTASALKIALERIDTDRLSADSYRLYLELKDELESPETLFESGWFAINAPLSLNLGVNIAPYDRFDYSNRIEITEDSDPEELNDKLDRNRDIESLIPYRYQDPAIKLGAEFYFGDNVYMEGQISIGNNNDHMYQSTLGWLIDFYDGQFYTTDMPDTENVSFMDRNFPHRAGLSAGNDCFAFVIGRFPHSMGSGVTGNLAIGDNFIYQDIMTVSFMSRWFTYNISLTHFDSMIEPWEHTDTSSSFVYNPYRWWAEFSPQKFTGPQQYRIAHRFDITPIDQLRVVLNLVTLYRTDSGLDIRIFEPFMVHHNLFNYTNTTEMVFYDEANNLMSLEIEGALPLGFSVSGQLVFDQITLGIEEGGLPPAYGILLNLKHSVNAFGGHFNSWFETVYSSPYLYLNGKYTTDGSGNRVYEYNLDYVVGYSSWSNADYGYSGYIYGPDNLTFSIGTEFEKDDYKIGGNLMYKIQGQNGLRHTSPWVKVTYIDMSHAVFPEDGNFSTAFISGGIDKAEHLLKLAFYGKLRFPWPSLELYGAMGFNMYWNYNNKAGDDRFLPQATIGIRWTGINPEWLSSAE